MTAQLGAACEELEFSHVEPPHSQHLSFDTSDEVASSAAIEESSTAARRCVPLAVSLVSHMFCLALATRCRLLVLFSVRLHGRRYFYFGQFLLELSRGSGKKPLDADTLTTRMPRRDNKQSDA